MKCGNLIGASKLMEKTLYPAKTARRCLVHRWAQDLPPGTSMLDAGAGKCRYRGCFSHCEYLSTDIASDAITVRSDICDLPFPDHQFDACLCTEVIEHVKEPIKAVHELARVLRPEGRILLTAPLSSGLHMEPYHFYGGFTPYWYRYFLSEAGFEQIEVQSNGGFFMHYGQESQRFSTMISPHRMRGLARYALAPVWVLTLPWFRGVIPLVCHFLDHLDYHRGFTVGYHVTALRS